MTALRIVKGTEPLAVEHPTIVIAGPPGICKTSLAYTWNGLLLDFDLKSYRAVGRRDTVPVGAWGDVQLTRAALEPYDGVTIDTVERCLAVMTTALLDESSRHGANGILHPRAHAILRQRFVAFLESITRYGKDTLVLAHAKEERDDKRTIRIEAPGASLGEVLKRADFVGYLTMVGTQRFLDFNPCERWIAKNPAGWPAMKVPPADQAREFVADLFTSARAALTAKSAESAAVAQQVETWRREVLRLAAAPAFNAMLPRVQQLAAILQPQVKRLLWDRAKALRVTYDVERAQFIDPIPGRAIVGPEPTAPAQGQVWRDRRAATVQPQLYSALTSQDGAR